MKSFYWLLILLLLSVGQIQSAQAAPPSPSGAEPRFPKPVEEYHDEQIPGITAKLVQRIQAEPFNLVGTLIFLGAIIHTFLASKFMLIAHRLEHQYHALEEQEKDTSVKFQQRYEKRHGSLYKPLCANVFVRMWNPRLSARFKQRIWEPDPH
jgi:hypothetical protein